MSLALAERVLSRAGSAGAVVLRHNTAVLAQSADAVGAMPHMQLASTYVCGKGRPSFCSERGQRFAGTAMSLSCRPDLADRLRRATRTLAVASKRNLGFQ